MNGPRRSESEAAFSSVGDGSGTIIQSFSSRWFWLELVFCNRGTSARKEELLFEISSFDIYLHLRTYYLILLDRRIKLINLMALIVKYLIKLFRCCVVNLFSQMNKFWRLNSSSWMSPKFCRPVATISEENRSSHNTVLKTMKIPLMSVLPLTENKSRKWSFFLFFFYFFYSSDLLSVIWESIVNDWVISFFDLNNCIAKEMVVAR